MDNADAAQPASRRPPTPAPTLRRRDRLRALISLSHVARRRDTATAPPTTSRFSFSQVFFPRRTTTETLHPTLPAHQHQVQNVRDTRPLSPIVPTSTAAADTGDLMARLDALEDYFDDDYDTPPAPASPTVRQGRRLSLRLRDLVDHRLLIPRNRAGSYFPQSPFCHLADSILLAAPNTENQSRFSYHNQPDTQNTTHGPFASPHRADTTPNMSSEAFDSLHPSDESQSRLRPPSINIHNDSDFSRPTGRPRSIIEAANISMPQPQDRRATWGAGRPWPVIGPSFNANADDSAGPDNLSPVSPLRRFPLQRASTVRESLSTQSLASTSPLTSLSSLFTRTASNQSSSSTLTPGSANGPRSPPVLRPGAARLATPSAIASPPLSEPDLEQVNHMDRLGRIARVQTRLRRQMNNLLSRRDTDDDMDMDITSILRDIRGGRLPRSRSADGSSMNGEPIAEGMAPFTIVGIRRVSPGTEVTGEDNLPPYIRELLGSTTSGEEGTQNSNDRRRPPVLRHGARRRGVLSFYDRMETPSREQALQLLQRRRPRSLYGAGSLRRNGVVGPDSPDDNLDDEDTDSSDTDEPTTRDDPTYIIYLIQGILPENHPLLSAPSLFTNNPTYEDMLYIASLLGPGKPPVASESDVASAPGLFLIEADLDGKLFAISSETEERIALPPVREDGSERPERCLVCLSDFEDKEEARKLIRCGHLFHKECIDQWLTEGRNSCPLCRGNGVEEKSPASSAAAQPAPLDDPLFDHHFHSD
ncbi:Zinc finger RING-type protein [Venturia nashicola]|uniref:Zinc finger RING-type protein n=1 Tax=Venturia nashicola TaxID=86259 RepID=A0A4Z1PNI4_9PEZI|nr:Zinc finger RING-type protein [Venturia nashicola]